MILRPFTEKKENIIAVISEFDVLITSALLLFILSDVYKSTVGDIIIYTNLTATILIGAVTTLDLAINLGKKCAQWMRSRRSRRNFVQPQQAYTIDSSVNISRTEIARDQNNEFLEDQVIPATSKIGAEQTIFEERKN